MRAFRFVVAGVTIAAAVVLSGSPAGAACHAFTISASPSTVDEGKSVTVTVERDAAFGPSEVRVTSLNGTATGGQDFPAVDRVVSFPSGTTQTFTVAITDDPAPEGAETFALHLSQGGGCQVNPNFTYGPDATVMISASDASAATTAAPTTAARATTTRQSTSSTSSSTSLGTTTTAEVGVLAQDSTSSTGDLALNEDDDDGGGAGPLVAGIAVVLVAGAGIGAYLLRRRGVF